MNKISKRPTNVSRTFLAHILGISIRRVSELALEGHLVRVDRGEYDLPASLQRYLALLDARAAERNAPSAADRLADQKSSAIAARIERQLRDLIRLEEALALHDEMAETFIDSIGRMPMLVAGSDARERKRIEVICGEEQARLRVKFAESREALPPANWPAIGTDFLKWWIAVGAAARLLNGGSKTPCGG